MDSEQAMEPAVRTRTDPTIDAEQEREYYEHLRRKYEPDKP
jgi:hypothetical protein